MPKSPFSAWLPIQPQSRPLTPEEQLELEIMKSQEVASLNREPAAKKEAMGTTTVPPLLRPPVKAAPAKVPARPTPLLPVGKKAPPTSTAAAAASQKIATPAKPTQPASIPADAVRKDLTQRMLDVKTEDSLTNNKTQEATEFRSEEVLEPKEWEQALHYLNDQQPQSMRDQDEAVDELKQSIANYAKMPAQVDLTPLMALTDAWSRKKTNFAGSYNKPLTGSEKMEMQAKLQNLLAGQRAQYTDSQMDMLKALTGGFQARKLLEARTEQTEQSNKPPYKPTGGGGGGNYKELFKEFERDVAKEKQAISAAQAALGALSLNSSVADQAVRTMIIRAAGDDRPSDYDTKAFGGNRSLQERINQTWQTIRAGNWTKVNVKQIRELLTEMDRVQGTPYDRKLFRHASTAPERHRIPYDKAHEFLSRGAPTDPAYRPGANEPKAPSVVDIINGVFEKKQQQRQQQKNAQPPAGGKKK